MPRATHNPQLLLLCSCVAEKHVGKTLTGIVFVAQTNMCDPPVLASQIP